MEIDKCIGGFDMIKIPLFMDADDYLQNPIMRRFLREHKLDFVENRARVCIAK